MARAKVDLLCTRSSTQRYHESIQYIRLDSDSSLLADHLRLPQTSAYSRSNSKDNRNLALGANAHGRGGGRTG